ncbi:MAG: DNA internalization-related competence protein ComEC/Rec2 [Lysobacterales bacterium]
MTGLLLTLCAAVLCGLYAVVHPWQILPWLICATGLTIPAGRKRLTAVFAVATLGLLVGQGSLEAFRQGQIQWLADPEFRVLTGEILNLPNCHEGSCQFSFYASSPGAGKFKVHWRQAPTLKAGDACALAVTLKPFWSLLNPGGFDAETFAFSQQWVASANVISGGCRPGLGLWARWQRFRDQLGRNLAAVLSGPSRALIPALVTGDRRGLSTEDWALLSKTGTAHLMAISGLHVSLVAGFGAIPALGLFAILGVRSPPRRVMCAGFGVLAATCYASLAGWSVSTQRACLMLLAPLGAVLLRRQWKPWAGLLLALTVIVLVSPQSAAGRGLWMSFFAVGVLLLSVAGRPLNGARTPVWRMPWLALISVQCTLLIGLFPLQLALAMPTSLAFVVINLIAVPWVSLVILPLALLGTIGLWVDLQWLLQIAGWNLDLLWAFLHWVSHQFPANPTRVPVPLWVVVTLSACLLAPRQLPGWSGIVPGALALCVSLGSASNSPTRLHVFDVGQGTATAMTERRQAILIDAGPGIPDGWNAGSAVVVPSLKALGVDTLERIIISHADADHSGGLEGLIDSEVEIDSLLGVSPDGRWPACREGMGWRWSTLQFQLWHPGPWLPYLGNDSSCVVSVSNSQHQIVLPGDVGRLVEYRLIERRMHRQNPTSLLVLGHHGSHTSTSFQWVTALAPNLAVATVGHQNRFDMPHFMVRQRLARHGTPLLSTAQCGYLAFDWTHRSLELTQAKRLQTLRPWHYPGLCPEPFFRSHRQ